MIEITSTDAKIPEVLLDIATHYGDHAGKGRGVLLEAKSAHWEKLFQGISGGEIIHWKKEGVEGDYYNFPQAEHDRTFYDLYPTGRYLISDEDGQKNTNLSFLRMQGLEKGVEVFFKGIFEDEMVKKYTYRCLEKSLSLYKKLSPFSVRGRIVLNEVERVG